MTAEWIFLLALSFRCVASNDDYCDDDYRDYCRSHHVKAPLGSSAVLPCNFTTSDLSWVKWTHNSPGLDLVRLSSEGRITFLDPRHGRVKAFPNQASEGNFTIRIDELQNSDLGCYRCRHNSVCVQVQLFAAEGTLSEDMKPLIFIGVSALVLLVVGVCCCVVLCIKGCNKENPSDPVIVSVAPTVGPSAPPVRTVVPAHAPRRGNDHLVYENDDQVPANADTTRNYCTPAEPDRTQRSGGLYPNLTQFTFERVESQRTRQRFHIELFSRLRRASSRHYYVNQSELNKQQATSTQNPQRAGLERQKKTNENCEYQNPIYNRSTEQLHRP